MLLTNKTEIIPIVFFFFISHPHSKSEDRSHRNFSASLDPIHVAHKFCFIHILILDSYRYLSVIPFPPDIMQCYRKNPEKTNQCYRKSPEKTNGRGCLKSLTKADKSICGQCKMNSFSYKGRKDGWDWVLNLQHSFLK